MPGRGIMAVWCCQVCGYVYDEQSGNEDEGIPEQTPLEALPRDWTCPRCGALKSNYRRID